MKKQTTATKTPVTSKPVVTKPVAKKPATKRKATVAPVAAPTPYAKLPAIVQEASLIETACIALEHWGFKIRDWQLDTNTETHEVFAHRSIYKGDESDTLIQQMIDTVHMTEDRLMPTAERLSGAYAPASVAMNTYSMSRGNYIVVELIVVVDVF